ncbi:MAG: sensor histidine kinase [Lachnospiraceae bacterium]|nr:sensor histidine kinase [Lachnospiraceae bacterium]
MEQALAFVFISAMWVCAFTYVKEIERNERFRLKVTLYIGSFYVLTLLFMIFVSVEVTFLRLIWRVIGMPVLLVFIYYCWNLSFSLSLYYGMWAFMSWQLMCELWIGTASVLRYLAKSTPLQELILSLIIFGVCNMLIRLTLARWMPEDSKEKLGPRQLISGIVIFSAFEVVGYTPGIDVYEPGKNEWLIIYLTQLLLGVILYLQSEMFKKSAMRQELEVMNMLWKKEQEQYEISRENIALINQKCHDLKHQIRAIRYMNRDEIDAYIKEVEDSIAIYESIVKTGNEVLDTILTEKSLYCKERGITVSCVADGSQMGFINTIDLYAILGNALDNAIEAVEKFQHEEKRQIDVMIYRQQQFLVINIVNPMKDKLVFEEELPRTTKKDRFHHGFGLRSIRYIVKKYDGNLNVSEEDGCFSLKILMPIPQAYSLST